MNSFDKTDSLKTLLLTLIISLWLCWLWTRRSLYRFALKHPGIFGIPILGVFHRIISIKNVLPALAKMFQECKSYTICTWMGMHPVLLTSDPDIIEMVVTNPLLLNKSKCLYEPLNNGFSGGIICSKTEKWRHNRKMINPSFKHNVLLSFLPIFYNAKNRTQQQFDALVGTGENKISKIIHHISLGVAIESTMGKDMHEDNSIVEFADKLVYLEKKVAEQILLCFLNLGGIYRLHIRYKKTRQMLYDVLYENVISMLKELANSNATAKSQTRTKTEEESEHEFIAIQKTPKIFIDQAMEIYQKQQFSIHDIVAESNTLVAAAFETTANGIYSVLVMLAMHPEVQEKVFEEISSLYPDMDVKMEYEDMQQLPYLNRVINETLRLAPSIPLIGRQVVQDTQLSQDLSLPKNLQIVISIYHLHRRTDIWGPNADKFDPDNFLPENMSDKHSYAFMPFSKGVRNCIGWRYAIFSMNVMLSGILRNYRFTTSFKFEDIRFVDNVSLAYLVEPGVEIHRR